MNFPVVFKELVKFQHFPPKNAKINANKILLNIIFSIFSC